MITEVVPPRVIYRLGRKPDPWAPPDWAYAGRFDGICYRSRYGDDIENWAVFEPFTAIRPRTPAESLDLLDADFVAALVIHQLSVEEAAAAN